MTQDIAPDAAVDTPAPAFTFDKFGFEKAIIKSIKKEGFVTPTPIQDLAILPVMSGSDLMGIAQTGSGKTAAFSLPTINKLIHEYYKPESHKPKVLILAPTRELVMQIGQFIDTFSRGTPIKSLVVAGGQPYQPQIRKLKYGVDILISTPGRLIDHMGSGNVKLELCETFILDEADRMLDMGFIDEVKEIQSNLSENHQTVMFSATMNDKVRRLSMQLLKEPEFVEQERKTMVAETITHKLMNVRRKNKTDLLIKILEDDSIGKALVFARTKLGADKLCDELKYAFQDTPMRIDAIHGDKKQRTREKILMNYRKGRTKVLVATDVAARGIDVDGITHVINYELPIEAENYVHRVGRTGRAGQTGIAISFCDPSDVRLLKEIERLIKMKVDIDPDHEYHFEMSEMKDFKKGGRGGRNSHGGPRGRDGGGRSGGGGRDRGGYGDKRRSEGGYGDKRRSEGKRPERSRSDKPSYGDKPKYEGKRSDKPSYGDKPRYSDKPKYEDKRSESKSPYKRNENRSSEPRKDTGNRYDPWSASTDFDDDPVMQKLRGKAKKVAKKSNVDRGEVKPKKKREDAGKRTTKRDHFDDKPKKNKRSEATDGNDRKTLSKKPTTGKSFVKKKGKPSRADRKKVKQTGGHKSFSPKRN